ncbi:MAG: glucose-6-phosphate isomerase [Clostridiales bacterium]|nr:glucose-6-phosphate isomerase [Clostridiales bacterium]
MAFTFSDKYLKQFVSDADLEKIAPEIDAAVKTLEDRNGAGNDFLGWVDLPVDYDKDEFARIKAAAKKIQKSCDVFVVIGIGGSYLGARAAIEFVKGNNYNALKKKTPDIYFVGNDISSSHLADVIALCKGKDVCVNVISKSGTTTEPAIAFRVFRDLLVKKYGKKAKDRIFATTDKARGALRTQADALGYESFIIPDDVGGRYSVLTAVGLLPIAVAGIDIDEMMGGAAKAREELASGNVFTNPCYKYAAIRNVLYRAGKSVEILVANDPALTLTCEWWKQLFGESEGKDGKGLYPSSAVYSTDLHSMGQFIQQGERVMFETFIDVNVNDGFTIPDDAANSDGLNFLSGKEMNFVNQKAFMGTVMAHTDGGVPNCVIDLSSRSAEDFGYLVYFFEKAVAVSGYTLGINPFDQPGVEAYKKNMFALLDKPGYSEAKAELEKRISEIG